jgi:hypothetical protein
MAQLSPQIVWDVKLTSQELLIILMSLGNRDMSEEQENLATELCDRLTKMRIDSTRNAMKQIDQLEENMKRKAS